MPKLETYVYQLKTTISQPGSVVPGIGGNISGSQ